MEEGKTGEELKADYTVVLIEWGAILVAYLGLFFVRKTKNN